MIEGEQVPDREIHHPLAQVKPDMTAKPAQRDSASRRVLVHAVIRLHGQRCSEKPSKRSRRKKFIEM